MDYLEEIKVAPKSDVKYFDKVISEVIDIKHSYGTKIVQRHILFIGDMRIYIKCFLPRHGCGCCGAPFHISGAKIQFHRNEISENNKPFFSEKLFRNDKKDNKLQKFDLLEFCKSKIGKTDFDNDFQLIINHLSNCA